MNDNTIKIEIGDNLEIAIFHIIQNANEGGVSAGEEVQKAFNIDFTKIVDNKFVELKKK